MSVTNSVCQWPIQRFGSDELRRRVLPELAAGAEFGDVDDRGYGLNQVGEISRLDRSSFALSHFHAWDHQSLGAARLTPVAFALPLSTS